MHISAIIKWNRLFAYQFHCSSRSQSIKFIDERLWLCENSRFRFGPQVLNTNRANDSSCKFHLYSNPKGMNLHLFLFKIKRSLRYGTELLNSYLVSTKINDIMIKVKSRIKRIELKDRNIKQQQSIYGQLRAYLANYCYTNLCYLVEVK